MDTSVPTQAPTFGSLVSVEPLVSPGLPVVAVVMAVLYLVGVGRLVRLRRPWSVTRTAAFLLGCAALYATTGLGVERYGRSLFSVFMFQQLTLMMTIPPLLVIGSPGTLLLRSMPHRGLGRVVLRLAHAGLRSPVARWALSPVVTLPVYLMSFYGLYLSDLINVILSTGVGHEVLEVLFLVSGLLFAIPIVSSDPLPVRMGHGGRALDVFVEAVLHAFFGVFVMMSSTLIVDVFVDSTLVLGMDPLADQGLAGGLAWAYGEAPTVLLLLYVMHRWFRDDTARARAADRRADQRGDDALDAYNSYLADLARRAETPRSDER